MEEMTDKQYNDNKRTLILLILEIIENSESLKEAKEKNRSPAP